MYRIEDKRLFFRESTIRFRDLRNLNPYSPVLDNICFFHSKADFFYETHVHDLYEIIIPWDTCYSCMLDNSKLELAPGSLLILQPGDKHQDILKKSQSFFAITFTIDVDDPMLNQEKIFIPCFHPEWRICKYSDTEKVGEMLDLLFEFSKKDHPRVYYILDGLFHAFFWSIITDFPSEALNPLFVKNSFQEDFKDNLMQIFQSNVYKHIGVKEIAHAMSLSPRSLERNCKKIIGLSPANAFADFKLKQIEKYVRHSPLSIREISDKFGFDNQFYFSRLFKKYFGKSPSQYRMFKQEWP